MGVYSLGVYNLVQRASDPEMHSPGLGVYSLGVYTLGVYSLGVYNLGATRFGPECPLTGLEKLYRTLNCTSCLGNIEQLGPVLNFF